RRGARRPPRPRRGHGRRGGRAPVHVHAGRASPGGPDDDLRGAGHAARPGHAGRGDEPDDRSEHVTVVPTVADLVRPGTTRIMGIVNVTPDSFSDGGRLPDVRAAVEHGRRLAADGADLLDVGGESTRPGSTRPDEAEEMDRVLPVVAELASLGHVVSVDTMRASVARACLEAGAAVVNDVSGGLADEQMPGVVAASGAPFVVMHWRGMLTDPHARPHYDDVVAEVCAELTDRVAVLAGQGVDPAQIVLDPGLGFS